MERIVAHWMRGERQLILDDDIALHQDYRNYLGMSKIGGCPRSAYDDFMNGSKKEDSLYWYGYLGYGHEALFRALLKSAGFRITPKLDPAYEAVAEFDPRYRGHFDNIIRGWQSDRYREEFPHFLCEIKSMNWDKFSKLIEPKEEHTCQFQAYLRHSSFTRMIAVYICRDVPHSMWERYPRSKDTFLPFKFFDVLPNEQIQDWTDERAKFILSAIDSQIRPECECGYCEG